MSVNCAAIPSTLIASELFGHERGAFTGALQRRLGRFELAEGGTIFLDEIGELPPETQIALLRVLQEREFERVGGSQPIHADVRVITATNRDLERRHRRRESFEKICFTGSTYSRSKFRPCANGGKTSRRWSSTSSIAILEEAGKKIGSIEKRTLELLQSYSWPGNIRELQNVIERSVIVCEADPFSVDPSWISAAPSSSRQSDGLIARKSAAEEKEVIEAALAATGGRISGPSGAAAQLGVPASTLESKIRSLKINKYRFKTP